MTVPSAPSLLRRLGVAGSAGSLATGGAAALVAAMAATAAPAAATTTFTVDDASDGAAVASDCTTPIAGSCSLRDAAAAAIDGDIILFSGSVVSITLTEGTIDLAAVSLIGPASSSLTVTTTAVAGSYDTFAIRGTGDVTVSGLTVTKNRINVNNDGDLLVSDVEVDDSEANQGGGLYTSNSGDVVITGSRFDGNSSELYGGAIRFGNDGDVTIAESTFTDNSSTGGGAIFVNGSVDDVVIVRSTLTGNRSDQYGGAFYSDNDGSVRISDSVFVANSAGGDAGHAYISGSGELIIERSTFDDGTAGDDGGALYVAESVTAVTITSSTFSNNTADDGRGGAIVARGRGGPFTIANSTLTGNSTGVDGGALYVGGGVIELDQVTIVGNSAYSDGGGIKLAGESSSLALSGSIISGNSSRRTDSADIDCFYFGSITSSGSLIGTSLPESITVTDLGGTIRSDAPGVEALADNGGPTRTMALSATSVAIDAGPTSVADFPDDEFDQRGPGFARVVGGRVDIGAFEVQPPSAPVVPAFTG